MSFKPNSDINATLNCSVYKDFKFKYKTNNFLYSKFSYFTKIIFNETPLSDRPLSDQQVSYISPIWRMKSYNSLIW